jgi:hypothetical protein
MDKQTEELFSKLVKLHKWDERAADGPKILPAIATLARRGAAFTQTMRDLEASLKTQNAEPPAGPLANLPPVQIVSAVSEEDKNWQSLRREAENSASLRALLASEPLLSKADPRAVATLAPMADVAPDTQSPQAMLYTQDGVFMNVFDAVLYRSLTEPTQLTLDYLAKFIFLYRGDQTAPPGEGLTEWLATLAETLHWQTVSASLEDARDYTDGADREAAEKLREGQQLKTTGVAAKLSKAPPVSRIPPELFALAWARRDVIDEALKPPMAAPLGAPVIFVSTFVDDELCASIALDLLRRDTSAKRALDDIEYALGLRIEMAQHFIKARRSAKLDALFYKWPEAARLAMSNPKSLDEVESYLFPPTPTPGAANFTCDESRAIYEMCERDQQLSRFLGIHPHFRDINRSELTGHRPAAPPSTAVVGSVATTTPVPRFNAVGEVSDAAPATNASPQLTPEEKSPSQTTRPTEKASSAAYETFFLRIRSAPPEEQTRPIASIYDVSYELGAEKSEWARINLSVYELAEELLSTIGIKDDQEAQLYLTRMFTQTDTEYLFRLTNAGKLLFKAFFEAHGAFVKPPDFGLVHSLLHSNILFRVVVETDTSDVVTLPWEWLAFPGQSENFLLSEKHSLVRSLPKKERPPERNLTPPLRVLALIPSPYETMRSEVERKAASLREVFESRAGVRTLFLTGEEATKKALADALFDLQPHILHFDGHVSEQTWEGKSQPCLLMAQAQPLFLFELKEMLRPYGVQLMLFRNNPAFYLGVNLVLEMVKGLMEDVLPAVIAPVRTVDDAPTLEFVRGFYRALLDGRAPEESLAAARRGLLGKGGDWTAFTLFSDFETLGSSRLAPPPG